MIFTGHGMENDKMQKKWKSCFLAAAATIAFGFSVLLPAGFSAAWAAEAEEDENGITAEDLVVTGLRWDESDGTAYWDRNDNAYKYEVKLYRGDNSRASKTTSERYCEFGSYFSGSGDYYFTVRAVGQNLVKGEWVASDRWYVSTSEAKDIRGYNDDDDDGTSDSSHGPGVYGGGAYIGGSAGGPGDSNVVTQGISGTVTYGTSAYGSDTLGAATYGGNHWCQDGYGWWYQYANGTYPKNSWQCIDGKYYCFNESGYCRYGWIYWDNKWYYCGADGALMGNAYTPDGYYVGADGVWVP